MWTLWPPRKEISLLFQCSLSFFLMKFVDLLKQAEKLEVELKVLFVQQFWKKRFKSNGDCEIGNPRNLFTIFCGFQFWIKTIDGTVWNNKPNLPVALAWTLPRETRNSDNEIAQSSIIFGWSECWNQSQWRFRVLC